MGSLVCEDVGEHPCHWMQTGNQKPKCNWNMSSIIQIPAKPPSSRYKSMASSAQHSREFLWIHFSGAGERPFKCLLGQIIEWGWKALCSGMIWTSHSLSRPHSFHNSFLTTPVGHVPLWYGSESGKFGCQSCPHPYWSLFFFLFFLFSFFACFLLLRDETGL